MHISRDIFIFFVITRTWRELDAFCEFSNFWPVSNIARQRLRCTITIAWSIYISMGRYPRRICDASIAIHCALLVTRYVPSSNVCFNINLNFWLVIIFYFHFRSRFLAIITVFLQSNTRKIEHVQSSKEKHVKYRLRYKSLTQIEQLNGKSRKYHWTLKRKLTLSAVTCMFLTYFP